MGRSSSSPGMELSSKNKTMSNKKQKVPRVETMVVAPEKHISIDAHELKMAIKNRLELEDRVLFDDLCKLMEGVSSFDFIDLKHRMQNNFLPFATGARNQIFLRRSSRNLPTTAILDQKEENFIADVYEVLRASHFKLLTREEWGLATQENFNLNLPMKINWDYMDHNLLANFWKSNRQRATIRSMLPDCMADRILVFHRGVGTAKLSGLLIDAKLDLLMDYTVFYLLDKLSDPLEAVYEKVMGLLKKKKKEPAEQPASILASANGAEGAAGSSKRAVFAPDVPEGRDADAEEHLRTAAMGRYQFHGNKLIASSHKFARAIERKTLARQCPTVLTLLKSFPLKMELQEPTFKDTVVLYRRAMPPRKPPSSASNAPSKTKDERLQGILQYRNIHIKVFGELPMADIEMIFPDKVVGVKPFQLFNLIVTMVTALVAGVLVVWRAGKDLNMNVMWTAASLVLTRCFAVYNTAQTQRTMLQQQMTSTLYDKMQDSQEGVVSVIMEEMADQQLKQMLVAYMMLIIKARPLLHDDLDNACEDFLQKEFDHPINYPLDDSLPRLLRWGLVVHDKQGKLTALPMSEAKEVLQHAWSEAYRFIGAEKTTADGLPVPTVDMITGKFSTFGAGIDQFKREKAAAGAGLVGKIAPGKALASVGSGVGAAVGAGVGGVGKALGKLPFGRSGSSSSRGAAAQEQAAAAAIAAPTAAAASGVAPLAVTNASLGASPENPGYAAEFATTSSSPYDSLSPGAGAVAGSGNNNLHEGVAVDSSAGSGLARAPSHSSGFGAAAVGNASSDGTGHYAGAGPEQVSLARSTTMDSTVSSSVGGSSVTKKKSSSLKNMFKKLKA